MTNEEARWILKFHRPDRPRSTDRRQLQKVIDVILDEGEWKYTHDTFSKRICNKCNYSQVIVDGMADNFCNNCGAKMKGGKEE